jgi:hypothetical protein
MAEQMQDNNANPEKAPKDIPIIAILESPPCEEP